MSTPYKPRVPRKFIGGYRPRIDGMEKAAGRARYADDLASEGAFPGLLYAKALRCPYPRARIKRLDTTRAAQLPGVKAILTYQDPEVKRLKMTNACWTDGTDTTSYARMRWYKFRDRHVLGDYGAWVGDDLGVVVAAESEQIAEQALRLLDIEWEVLPFVLDYEDAMQPGAPIIHPDIAPTNVLPPDDFGGPDVFVDRGDVEQAFAKADVVVAVDSRHHNPTQGSLDAWCCVVDWKDDNLTLWSNSYAGTQSRMHLSQMLEVPLHKVRSISYYVGGQFGRGDTGDQTFFLFTALLAKKTGRPVKYKHTRRNSFHDTRQSADYHCIAAAQRDGTITGLSFLGYGNAGAHADNSVSAFKHVPQEIVEVALAHIPNLRLEAYVVYTDRIPGCMMRGIGNSQFNFTLCLALDALAEKLEMDPIDLVIRNFGHEWGEIPDKSLSAVLREGAQRIGWHTRHQPGKGPLIDGVLKRGVGFSFHPAWHAEWQEWRRGQVQANLTLHPDLSVTLDAPTIETGTGSNTCNVLGCAEALSFLGIGPEDISWVVPFDTDRGLRDCVQTDSAVSYLQSEVLSAGANELKRRLIAVAAPFLNAEPAALDIQDGRVIFRADPEQGMALQDVMWRGDLGSINVHLSRPPNSEKTGVPYFATFAEVDVDVDTGRIETRKLVVLNDCGTVMYATGAEAQQIGGQVMALGEALTEELIYDKASGIPLNFNFIDYKIPTLVDMPEIEPVLLEVWRGAGEYGACGIGEGAVTCTPRAVANAVYNAIGVRIDDLPLTPEKVLHALGKS